MKKTLLLILLIQGACFAATNDAPVVPTAPSLGDFGNLLVKAAEAIGAVIAAAGLIWNQINALRKSKAFNALSWAVETFKEREGLNGNSDLKAHIESQADKLGTANVVQKEMDKAVAKMPEVLKTETKP